MHDANRRSPHCCCEKASVEWLSRRSASFICMPAVALYTAGDADTHAECRGERFRVQGPACNQGRGSRKYQMVADHALTEPAHSNRRRENQVPPNSAARLDDSRPGRERARVPSCGVKQWCEGGCGAHPELN
jgi:hypothetical protein